jgi:zinc/manganese transport system ATP-binding protein
VVTLTGAAADVAGRRVWSGATLRVAPGEFVAVLGPNGAGKSTLLKALLGEVRLTEGDADVLGAAPGERAARVGYLPQRRSFDSSVRVRGIDVVRMGWDGHRWGIPLPGARSREAKRRVAEVIELVGAQDYACRPIGSCSGGEQQRLLIAQALVRQPELLLLDEPLDSLDVTSQAAISKLIRSVCRSLEVAVIMVAHDVNPILPYLDQVMYLARGDAVTGTPGTVINAETLTNLYGTPIDVLTDRSGRLVVVGQQDVPPGHDLET